MTAASVPEPVSRPGGRLPLALTLASAVGAALAHLGAVAMPFQIGAVMDARGLSPAMAGLFGFMEMGALALSMILLAPLVSRFAPALLALSGAVVAALANLAIFAFAPGFAGLCLLAAIAGAGYGTVFSATIAGVSASPRADRIFALSSGGSVLVVVALMTGFPAISARFGTLGPFFGIGTMILLTTPFLTGFGWRATDRAAAEAPGVGRALVRSPAAIAIYLVWACFSLASGVAWSFAERIGRAIALDPATIGTVLSASTFVGIAGTLVAAIVAGRWPRLLSAGIGLGGTALGLLLFPIAGNAIVFAVGAVCFWISSMFFYCVMLGIAAAIDPSGRVGTSGGGFDRLGFACGAPLGGLLLDHASYPALGIAAFAICLLPLPYAWPVLRRALRNREGGGAA